MKCSFLLDLLNADYNKEGGEIVVKSGRNLRHDDGARHFSPALRRNIPSETPETD